MAAAVQDGIVGNHNCSAQEDPAVDRKCDGSTSGKGGSQIGFGWNGNNASRRCADCEAKNNYRENQVLSGSGWEA
jgi:hypothetical protein